MALITPGSLYYIISVSIASRLLIFGVQIIGNSKIADHNADAYRNRYHKALVNHSDALQIPNSYLNIYYSIEGFTKWDSQYFLEISMDGYVSEEHLAFMPIYPTIISITRQLLFEHKRIDLNNLMPNSRKYLSDQEIGSIGIESYIRSALIGFALNNFIFFPLAAIALFILTKLAKKKDDKYAKDVVFWFCFNPAGIFFSACYSESLFSALTFIGMFLIEYRSHEYLRKHIDNNNTADEREFKPLTQLNRLLQIFLPSLAFFSLSTATRSNGLINIGFLCYQFLLKYVPLLKQKIECWSIIIYISVILEFFQDILVLFMSVILAASGYITFQIYSYIKFCIDDKSNFKEKGVLYAKPDWCQDMFPHPYRQVQEKYWQIGAFKYYKIKQTPNFLLALPITYIVMKGALKKSEDILKFRDLDKRQLAYYVQAIVLIIMIAIFAHVQVTTRLLSACCPVYYWIITDRARSSRRESKILLLYCFTYIIIGTLLHTNFYPWT